MRRAARGLAAARREADEAGKRHHQVCQVCIAEKPCAVSVRLMAAFLSAHAAWEDDRNREDPPQDGLWEG